MDKAGAIHILWDYMCPHGDIQKADCIIGFGCYNEDVAVRAAELYREHYAPLVLFSGGLGRNTRSMWDESEAQRFARIAIAEGVPESAVILETRSENSGENLIFSKQLLSKRGLTAPTVIGVHKPYMERRLAAAFPVYWPEARVFVTSCYLSFEDYVKGLYRWGRTEDDTVHMLTGDFQRILLYPALGYQLKQEVPDEVMAAYELLLSLGYTKQLIK